MNGEILVHGSPLAVRTYMLSKLKLWTSWRYSKSERIKKSLLYYETASIPNRGVGGEFEASIKSSLFGATEIKFKAAATLGFGSGAETATKINFTRIGLAGASQFRKLVYLPTVLQGYKTDLTDYDKMNTHYLNKSLAKLKEELESQRSSLKSLNKVPVEKQSLLLGMDDD